RKGNATWVILAAPFSPPAAAESGTVSQRVLEFVNQARSRRQRCGRMTFAPAPPLRLDSALSRAALVHARDMAARGTLTHTGQDGSAPSDRITAAGYAWSLVGEN